MRERIQDWEDAVSTTGERSTGTVYEQVQASPEFADLRSRLRRFVFPMSAAFLVWYLAYVLLASYAPAFMATKVIGNINIGLIIGLLQFVSTFVITTVYVRYANKHLDPAAEKLRERIEGAA
jgi:Predicted membrane protein